jgi:peptidyl-prolyl cis-trans isomerase C
MMVLSKLFPGLVRPNGADICTDIAIGRAPHFLDAKPGGQIRGGSIDVNAAPPLCFPAILLELIGFSFKARQLKSIANAESSHRLEFSLMSKSYIPTLAVTVLAGAMSFAAWSGFADDKKVLAKIGDVEITEGEVNMAGVDLDPQFAKLPPEQRRLAAIAALIDIKAMAIKGAEAKFDQTDSFKTRMAFLHDRALHNAYFESEVINKITDEEVRARFDKEIAATPPQSEIRARHILVKTTEEAQEIIKQLDGGASFEELAKSKSTDGAAAQGGDLGYFGSGQMVPEFEKAAMALEVGAYTKTPVQTQFGFHVVKVEDKRAKQPPEFEKVKAQVKNLLLQENYVARVKTIRNELKVEYVDPEIKAGMEANEAANKAAGEKAAPAK